ncbi:MAG: ABC transporter ATP-binding protein, partial [Rhodoferax sp.]
MLMRIHPSKTCILIRDCYISGILKPSRGHILFEGRDITGLRADKVARAGLLQVPEGRQILGGLTVEENLLLGTLAASGRALAGKLDEVFELFTILKVRRGQEAGSLSGGEQQMLAIGRALMGRPRLLVLDEPSLGLAPIPVKQVFDALARLNKDGLTILVVEQNARLVLEASRFAYVLEQGKVVHHGPSVELRHDPRVIEHYLPKHNSST